MSQTTKVLSHLNKGLHITPLQAIGLYGIYRLAARINDLRKQGYPITTQVVRDTTGRPYARYQLCRSVMA